MIGSLRDRITIQTFTEVTDNAGGFERTYSTLDTVWANVRPLSARERFFAEKVEHNITHAVDLRYRSDVDSKMRFTFDSRTFQIHGILNVDGRKRFLTLMAEEGVGS